jgi:tetratricopeptide (TPR) repeat protein
VIGAAQRRLLAGAMSWALLVALSPPAAASLSPLPDPALAGFEEAVRRQLTAQRTAAARVLDAESSDDAARAAAYGDLGRLYFAYEILDAAEPCLRSARELAPEEFTWTYLLGALEVRTGDVEDAVESLAAAAALRPRYVPARLRLGRLFLDLGRLGEAEAEFSAALSIDPGAAAAHHGLGRIAQERGDWGGSIGPLQRALELQPSASSVHYLLGIAYRELGDPERARRHLGANGHVPLLFADPEIDGLDGLVEAGRYYLQLGDLARGRGDREAAIEAYREALERSPDDPRAHYNLGVTLMESGEAGEGRTHLEEAVRLDPEFRDAHFNLGMALAGEERLAEAEGHFRRAAEIDPQDAEARVAWARALALTGRGAEAEGILEALLARHPGDGEAELALADALEAQGRPGEAGERLRALLETATDSQAARAHLGLSRLALAAGDRAGAIERLRAATRIDPGLPGAMLRLGTLLGQERAFAEAASAFRGAVEEEPHGFPARFGLAMSLLLSEQAGAASRALEEALDFVGDDLALRHLLARVLATAPEAAVRDGERALALAQEVYGAAATSDHAETVAMALAEVGRFEGAASWQQRALELAPPAPSRRRELMARRLEAYRRGEACRAPWFDD